MISISHNDEPQGSLLPDLTPLLDVIFIVMVFLMFTANVAPNVLQVDLPEAGAEAAVTLQEPDTLAVNLMPGDEGWAIDGQRFSDWDAFASALKHRVASQPERPLMIAGDRNVPMERLVQLLAFLQQNNMTAAQIQMEDAR